MQTIDLLIQNAHVVTFDDAGTVIPDGAIAVRDGAIADVGPSAELGDRYAPAERVFAHGSIAMPGLVDAHVHTAQTLMRGLITTLGRRGALRVPFWREYYVPFEAMLTPEDMELSGLLAYTNMIANGTTAFWDAGGPHPDAMGRAAVETGIRGLVSLSTMDGGSRIPDSMRTTTEQALQGNLDLVGRWPSGSGERVAASLSLRQIITCSTELVTAMAKAARELDVKIHTHLVEGTYEIDHCLEAFGRRPIDHLIDLGVFDRHLHGAHSVLTAPRDVESYVAHGASACHCALGNPSIGPAPALDMWRRGVAIGLGTDGVNTRGTLDLFQVAHGARTNQQLVYGTPYHDRFAVEPAEPLTIATRGGSRALGLADRIGSLEAGKRADVVLLGLDAADAAASITPEAFLYEAANGRDVHTVFVEGRAVMRDRAFTTVDVAEIRARAAARQRELAARFLP
ncbi:MULTISPECIES: amidohydrolase family protein [Actinomadura]|uniref:Amidohydrolase family protein n=1 Tax=Actinomadura yumaensis TaxID=111807 RepID=A0ABW2CTR8_9ACTN|nr:amidohydrolase family protein [Actinomadura sp. J1-007]MWK38619.1 amidohydrolase family protein [Actinomadura sp. J1-007]